VDESEEENLRNIVVYWKVRMISQYCDETRRLGSLKDAQLFVMNYKAQQQADHKIYKVTEEEIE
jgi:hypothetical protein